MTMGDRIKPGAKHGPGEKPPTAEQVADSPQVPDGDKPDPPASVTADTDDDATIAGS
jgi:hypothetical protein